MKKAALNASISIKKKSLISNANPNIDKNSKTKSESRKKKVVRTTLQINDIEKKKNSKD